MTKIIFFGNGPLADYALEVLKKNFNIVFHARTREDLEKVREIKTKNPKIHGVLASFGVMIKPDLLELFEPEGILNIHPSKLPKYRGASPIESAILDGNTDFSVSIMKLAPKMDAGPVYYQTALTDLPLNKSEIYHALASAGAKWLVEHLSDLPTPVEQDESQATFCGKLDKSMSEINPMSAPAEQILRRIIAFQGYPKPKYRFYAKNCIILDAHLTAPDEIPLLQITCIDNKTISVDRLQPEGKKPMDAKSFLNGYKKS